MLNLNHGNNTFYAVNNIFYVTKFDKYLKICGIEPGLSQPVWWSHPHCIIVYDIQMGLMKQLITKGDYSVNNFESNKK